MSIESRFDLTGKVAFITGGGRGIGRSISQVLAEAGASLMLVGRDLATLERTRTELSSSLGARAEIFKADLGDRMGTESAAADALSQFGRIDILVHCAGLPSEEAVVDITDEGWDKVCEVNLFAAAALTRAFVPRMKERCWGRLIYISSAATERAYSDGQHAAYSASKAGLHGFMRAVAAETGRYGVTANCIVTGIFKTDMSTRGSVDPRLIEALAAQSAVGRVADTCEMGGPVLLLASDAGKYITGSLLYVDGGYTILK